MQEYMTNVSPASPASILISYFYHLVMNTTENMPLRKNTKSRHHHHPSTISVTYKQPAIPLPVTGAGAIKHQDISSSRFFWSDPTERQQEILIG